MSPYATVPRIWDGRTVACLATGPSLCEADVAFCRGKAELLAVKDAVRLAPDAGVLYCCGRDRGRWWATYGESLQEFYGLRYTLDPSATKWAQLLKEGPVSGLSTDPTMLCTGRHSGYQAVGLAFLLGAARILLLGYDLKKAFDGREYFFGREQVYPRVPSPYDVFLSLFQTIVEPLRKHGVEVINCSRVTALSAFPRQSLDEALA